MKSYVVGIDIGGTNTKLGIVDSRGTVLAKDSIKTNKHQCVEDYIEDLHKAFTALTRVNGLEGEIGGIGVGAPNANYFKGTIEYAANLPWKGIVPFAELMEKKFGIPVKITNDANAAAIGEMTYGAARGVKDFIMITLGTGVGSGIVANGQLIYGSDGNAGELGHVIVRECHSVGTVVHMAVNGKYAGHILISDQIKPHAKEAIAALKKCGVKKTIMLMVSSVLGVWMVITSALASRSSRVSHFSTPSRLNRESGI